MYASFIQTKEAEIKTGTIQIKLHYRNNPDGTIRWIWPASLKQPVFLKFYNAASFKAKLVTFVIQLLFAFRLQKLFASVTKIVSVNEQDYNEFLDQVNNNWSLFNGTAGVHQTPVFYGSGTFIKLPVGKNAPAIIHNEYLNMLLLNNQHFNHIQFPMVEFNQGILKQNDISSRGKRSDSLTNEHWNALLELSLVNRNFSPLYTLPFWQQIEHTIADIESANDQRLPKGLIRKLKQLIQSIDPNTTICTSLSHGDFTPWNMFVKKEGIALFDWELASSDIPVLFDAFHFVYQQASLVDHLSPKQLQERIKANFDHTGAKNIITEYHLNAELYHCLYLLHTITYYLDAYVQQKKWHPQVAMSLSCWHDALTIVISEGNIANTRNILIRDVFDFLHNKDYAALKWIYTSVDKLPEYSDIDLCVSPSAKLQLKQFLLQHPLVAKLKQNNKSFMSSYFIQLPDGNVLSIDAVTAFKRRGTVMLDAAELLCHAEMNSNGIKVPAVQHDVNYLWLFYLLNNAAVPEHYKSFYNFYSTRLNRELNELFVYRYDLDLSNYREIFDVQKIDKHKVIHFLYRMPENKGFQKIKNHAYFLWDTIRDSFYSKGYIVTFSGVDGAGKSTVIENVKHIIEKKYRRKVVVLRHRPSFLPMISGIKYGRKNAEERSASVLPRQGNNKNIFSSLIRFGYYYTDYFIGQFLIYLKYVLRGYVVLYDRFYFDFINDSRRSNINLPSAFTSLGYALLLKPKYNFFLYADANTILLRKKELDSQTIVSLTKKYRRLFERLAKIDRSSHYISIENKELPLTLSTILNHVNTKA